MGGFGEAGIWDDEPRLGWPEKSKKSSSWREEGVKKYRNALHCLTLFLFYFSVPSSLALLFWPLPFRVRHDKLVSFALPQHQQLYFLLPCNDELTVLLQSITHCDSSVHETRGDLRHMGHRISTRLAGHRHARHISPISDTVKCELDRRVARSTATSSSQPPAV